MWRITPPDHLSCGQISPHDQIFSTGTAHGARDKYEVCVKLTMPVRSVSRWNRNQILDCFISAECKNQFEYNEIALKVALRQSDDYTEIVHPYCQ